MKRNFQLVLESTRNKPDFKIDFGDNFENLQATIAENTTLIGQADKRSLKQQEDIQGGLDGINQHLMQSKLQLGELSQTLDKNQVEQKVVEVSRGMT